MGRRFLLGLVIAGVSLAAAPAKRPLRLRMEATGYSIEGRTKSQVPAQEGVAAADPRVLPLGTRIRVRDHRGLQIGEFVVADTGSSIKGQEIDIYFAKDREAKRFGRKKVRVEILEWGSGAADARQEMRNNPPSGP